METATADRELAPQRWQHRRTQVEAMRYDGTTECRVAIWRWVIASGGEAQLSWDELLVKTQVKWVAVPVGFWVGLGYIRQNWVISHEVFTGCYDPAEGANHLAVVDRDQAAAMVVAADEIAEAAKLDDEIPGQALGLIEKMRLHIHQLATTAEALR